MYHPLVNILAVPLLAAVALLSGYRRHLICLGYFDYQRKRRRLLRAQALETTPTA